MGEKQLISASKMTASLICSWLLYGMGFGFFSEWLGIGSLLKNYIKSFPVAVLCAVVFHGVIIILIWKFSIAKSFKQSTIAYDDVPIVMRNLMIFTVVMCLLDGIYNVSTANYSFNKSIDSNYGLKYSESILSNIYSGEQMAEYNRLKEEAIREARGKLNTYLILFELGVTAVYLAVLPFEKKRILKYIGYGGYYD